MEKFSLNTTNPKSGYPKKLTMNHGLKLALLATTPQPPWSVSSEVTLPPSLRTAPLRKHAMKLITLAYPAGLSVSSGPLPKLVLDKPPPAT